MCELSDALEFVIRKLNMSGDLLNRVKNNETHTGKRFLVKGVMREIFIKAKGIRVQPFDIQYYRVENGLPSLRVGTTILCKDNQFILVSAYPELEPVKILTNDLPDLSEFENKKIIVQYKIDGYNTRLVYIDWLGNYVAILRGGDVDLRTTYLLWNEKTLNEKLINFFSSNRNIIINAETVGGWSLNTHHADYYKKHFGIDKIGFFVFDMMKRDESAFLPYRRVVTLSKEYAFLTVKTVNNLDISSTNAIIDNILNPMYQEGVYEGLVFKEDSEAYTRLMKKLRLEYFKRYKERYKKKPKKKSVKSIETVILEHFIQGYPEPPWLTRGITSEETKELNMLLDKLRLAIKERDDIGVIARELNSKLLAFILSAIDKKMSDKLNKDKLEKVIKSYIGKQIGKLRKHT